MYSLENLISWLETKNPKESYNYVCGYDCVLAQYFREKVPDQFSRVYPYEWMDKNNKLNGYPDVFEKISQGPPDAPDITLEWTFGKALKRARTYLDDQRRQTN